MSAAATNYFATEEGREKTSTAVKLYFEENPEARQHMSEATSRRFENAVERQKMSAAQLRRYADLAEHEKLREVFNRPDVAQRKRVAQVERFKDINERVKISNALSKPSTKRKLRNRSIVMWAARSTEDRTAIAQKTWATRHKLDAADLVVSSKKYSDVAKRREATMSKEVRSKRAYKAWITRRANIEAKKVRL